ncbi:ABC transporter permease, partial [Kocuria subflava]
ISTLSTMVIIAAMIAFNAFMADRATEHDLATSGPLAAEAVEQADAAMGDKTTVTGREVQPVEAEDLVRDEEVDAALIHDGDSWSLVADTEIDSDLETAIEQAVSQVTVADNAEDHGTTVEQLNKGSALETTFLSVGEDRGLATYLLRFAFAFLFYMAALIFGMAIANSVLEEKQNRVVEILATAIPLRELLYGKVLGNCLGAF